MTPVMVDCFPMRHAVVSVCAMFLLAFCALGFYALRKMKPASVKVRTTLGMLFTFNMEIQSSDVTDPKPAGEISNDANPSRP